MSTNIYFEDAASGVGSEFGQYERRVKVDSIRCGFNAKFVTVKMADNVEEILEGDTDGWIIQRFEPGGEYKVVLSEERLVIGGPFRGPVFFRKTVQTPLKTEGEAKGDGGQMTTQGHESRKGEIVEHVPLASVDYPLSNAAQKSENIYFEDAASGVGSQFGQYERRVHVKSIRRAFNAKSVTVKMADNVEEILEADTDGWSTQRFEPGGKYKLVLSEERLAKEGPVRGPVFYGQTGRDSLQKEGEANGDGGQMTTQEQESREGEIVEHVPLLSGRMLRSLSRLRDLESITCNFSFTFRNDTYKG